jgi:hypothetical protein
MNFTRGFRVVSLLAHIGLKIRVMQSLPVSSPSHGHSTNGQMGNACPFDPRSKETKRPPHLFYLRRHLERRAEGFTLYSFPLLLTDDGDSLNLSSE